MPKILRVSKITLTAATLFLISLVFVPKFNSVNAVASSRINFQSKIVDKTTGLNIVSGSPACVVGGADTCDFKVNIYSDASGGTLLWSEPTTDLEIGATGGYFNIEMNAVCNSWTAPSGSCSGTGIVWGSDDTVYVELQIDADGDGDFASGGPDVLETFARKLFTSVPYAYYADNAGSLNGISSTGFVTFTPAATQTTTSTNNLINLESTATASTNTLILVNENGTGTPNLLALQNAGTTRFQVGNLGETTINTTSTSTLFSATSTATAATNPLILVNENGTGTPNLLNLQNAGVNRFTVGNLGETTINSASTSSLLSITSTAGAGVNPTVFINGSATGPSTILDVNVGLNGRLRVNRNGQVSLGVGSCINGFTGFCTTYDSIAGVLIGNGSRVVINSSEGSGTGSSLTAIQSGSTASVSFTGARFSITNNNSALTTTLYGVNNDTISSGPVTSLIGINNAVTQSSTATTSTGINNFVAGNTSTTVNGIFTSAGIDTGTTLNGINNLATFQGTGTVANVNGIITGIQGTAVGTLTTGTGILVSSATTAGTITTNYGIRVQNQTAGTTDYGLYLDGADTAALYVNAGLSRFAPATTARSSINLATSAGVDPTTPNSGDLWWNGTNLNFRTASTTVDLLAGGGGGTFVNFIPGSTQSTTSTNNLISLTSTATAATNPLIFLNENGTGTPNILDLQVASTSRLILNNAGQLQLSQTGSTGGILVGGDLQLYRSAANEGTVTGSLLPSVDDTYALGSNSNRWSDLYLGPSTIFIGTSGNDYGISYNTAASRIEFNNVLDDRDVRFSGQNVFNLIYLDAANDSIGIGTNNPTAMLDLMASTAASASFRLRSSSGTNPTTPNEGDLWWNGTNLNFRTASSTIDLTGGTNGYVQFAPAATQSTTSTNNLISLTSTATAATNALVLINENGTGTPDLLRLQNTSTTVFTIGNGGDAIINTASTNTLFSATSTATAATNPLILVNENGTGTPNLFVLQNAGTTRFQVGNLGETTINTTSTANLFSLTSTATAATNALVLVNENGTGTPDLLNLQVGGSNVFAVLNNGGANVTITNALAGANVQGYSSSITNNAAASTVRGLDINTTNTSSTPTIYGANIVTANTVAATAGTVYGIFNSVSNSSTSLGTLYGSANSLVVSAATSAQVIGVAATITGTASSSASIVNGLYAGGSQGAGATWSEFRGVDIGSLVNPSGTVTTNYGIYIRNQTTGVTDYGIYIVGAQDAAIYVQAGLSRFAPATTANSSTRLASSAGVDPTTPVSGDLWWNGTNLNFRTAGTTVDLLTGGGGGGTYVNFTPATTQSTTSTNNLISLTSTATAATNPLILVNENGTGTPNLLNLQVAGSDVLTVSNAGNLVATGNGSFGTATSTAFINAAASTTAKASARLISSAGVDPTTPNSGDLWWNGTNLNFRTASSTIDLTGGTNGYVQFAPAATQTTTSTNNLISLTTTATAATNPLILVNENGTGTPNLLELQNAGSTRFQVGNLGETTISSTSTANLFSLTSTATAASNPLILVSESGTGTPNLLTLQTAGSTVFDVNNSGYLGVGGAATSADFINITNSPGANRIGVNTTLTPTFANPNVSAYIGTVNLGAGSSLNTVMNANRLSTSLSGGTLSSGAVLNGLISAFNINSGTVTGGTLRGIVSAISLNIPGTVTEVTGGYNDASSNATSGTVNITDITGVYNRANALTNFSGVLNATNVLGQDVRTVASSGGTATLTVTNLIGSRISNTAQGSLVYGSPITKMAGIDITNNINTATSSVSNAYGILINTGTNSGTITTNYGIRVENQTTGTTDYGLYLGGADTAALYVNAGLSRFAPATTGASSVNLASSAGVDPTTPNSGDLWWNGTNLNFRTASSTIDLTGGTNGYVQFAPAATQSTTSTNNLISLTSTATAATNPLILVNENGTGTPNLLELQNAGTTRFQVGNLGETTINTTSTANLFSLTSTATAATNALVLVNENGTGTPDLFTLQVASANVFNVKNNGDIEFVDGFTRNIVDTAGNNLVQITDIATNFGATVESGAIISRNSETAEEFQRDRADVIVDTVNGWGDFQTWTADEQVNTTQDCIFSTIDDAVNGIGRIQNTQANVNCMAYNGTALANLQSTYAAANLPVVIMKIRPNRTTANDDTWVGLGDTVAFTATDPTNGIYFTNNNGTTWTGVTRNASTSTNVVCTGATISTTQFALLKIEVRSTTDVRFYADADVSNGVNWISCGTSTTNIPSAALASFFKWSSTSATGNLDIDYFRTWQDDSAPAAPEVATTVSPDASLTNPAVDLPTVLDPSLVTDVQPEQPILDPVEPVTPTIDYNSIVQDVTGLKYVQSQDGTELNLSPSTGVSNIVIGGSQVSIAGNLVVAGTLNVQGDLVVAGNLEVKGELKLSSNNLGKATIPAGETEIRVDFDTAKANIPFVTVNPVGTIETKYWISNKDQTGFTIKIDQPALVTTDFEWLLFTQ